LVEGACFRPNKEQLSTFQYSYNFDLTLYPTRDRQWVEFKDDVLVQFKEKFSSDEFVLIGINEEKAFFDEFADCVDKPDPSLLSTLKDAKGIKSKVDVLINSVKTKVKTMVEAVTNFTDSVEQEGWLNSIGDIIINESGFIGQITQMKKCFEISQSKNAALAARLNQGYNPYFGFSIDYEFGKSMIVGGNVYANLGFAFGYSVTDLSVVDSIQQALHNKDVGRLIDIVKGIK